MLSTNLESILSYLHVYMFFDGDGGGEVRFWSYIVGTYDSFSSVLKHAKLWVETVQFTPINARIANTIGETINNKLF